MSANAFVFDNLADAEYEVQKYEFDNKFKYVHQRQDKDFSKYDVEQLPSFIQNHKVRWNDVQRTNGPVIISDGTPFVHLGSRTYICHQGPNQQKKKENCNADHDYVKKKKASQPSKKVSCPSEIRMRAILRFEGFQTNVDAPKHVREKASRAVRRAINEQSLTPDDVTLWVLVKFPEENDHVGHFTNELALYTLPLDKDVASKIKSLVKNGIHNVNVIKKIVETFVREDLAVQVPKSDRRFYPSDKTIRSLKKYTLDNLRDYDKDEAALDHQISTWREDGTLGEGYIRLRTKEKGQFLFIYQSEFQKRLLLKYGNNMVLMDATYRYSLYDVPLYQLCVPTNVGYFVVATFITEYETAECVTEALTFLKEAVPLWKPEAFMVDDDEREIIAIQSVFPEADIFLCEFHRMQAWVRRLNAHKISLDVLPLMKAIAGANSVAAYDEAIKLLEASTFWKASSELRTWFSRHWLKYRKRWVVAFRTSHIHLTSNTTNGLERQHEELKRYLSQHGDRSLLGTVTCIVRQFTPESQMRYEEANVRASSMFKPYSADVPAFLHNRPPKFVDHCALRLPPQVQAIPADHVTAVSPRLFTVKSVETPDAVYELHLGSEEVLPSCNCPDFERTGWVCKHFLAVFEHCADTSWESLPSTYKDSPVFNLDVDVLGQDGAPQSQHNSCSSSSSSHQESSNPAMKQQLSQDQAQKPTAEQEEQVASRLGARVRSVLNYLKNQTYVLEEATNSAALTTLLQSLNKVKQSVSGSDPKLKPVFRRGKNHKIAKTLLKKYKSRRQRQPIGLRKKHTSLKKTRVPKPTRKVRLNVPTAACASTPACPGQSSAPPPPPSPGPQVAADSLLSPSERTTVPATTAVCRRGMLNKAQNCWLNATLQAVETVVPGQSILMRLAETSVELDREVTARLQMLAQLMDSLSTLPSDSVKVDASAVLREIYTCFSYLPGRMGQQEDAQEFLLPFLADLMISGCFEGMEISWTKQCFECEHITSNGETVESCLSLEVEVDHDGNTQRLTSVRECLEFYFQIWETMLDTNAPVCENCGSRTGGSARLPQLNNCPELVVCHLKRFKFEDNTSKKLCNMVDVFSSRTIELNGTTYDLCAIVCHIGLSIRQGHYVAAVKTDEMALYCNDHTIKVINFDDFLYNDNTESQAYLLFYKKRASPVDGPCGKNPPEISPRYNLREPKQKKKRSSWTPAGRATARLQRGPKTSREMELEKTVMESNIQKQMESDELLSTLKSAPVKSHLQKIIRGELVTKRSKLFTMPLARSSENQILALGCPLGPFDDVSEIVPFCDQIYSEMSPTDQRFSSDRVKYILYVLVPEAIIRAIQIRKSCGVAEAEDVFVKSSAFSKEEVELDQLALDRQGLTKSEERSVNRRANRGARNLGVNLKFNHKELYSSSDDDY